MSLNVNQAHVNKASTLLTAGVTAYDGITRLNAVRNNQTEKAFGGTWVQAAIGLAEIGASFFAGKAALQ